MTTHGERTPRRQSVLPEIRYCYREYKRNSKEVARWITITAAKLTADRINDDLVSATSKMNLQGPSKSPAGRGGGEGGRGKKRTMAQKRATKAAASKKPGNNNQAPSHEKEIPLNQLVKLCKLIGDSDVKTPVWVLAKLASIIQHRKAVTAFYSSNAETTESNKSHVSAIRRITKAFDHLGGKSWMETFEDDQVRADVLTLCYFNESNQVLHATGDMEKELVMGIYFSHLGNTQDDSPQGVETDEDLQSYDIVYKEEMGDPPNKQRQGSTHTIQFGDMEIAILHVLHNMNVVRTYLYNLWSNVSPQGPVTNLTASYVTNRGVQLVKQLEERLEQDFPNLNCYRKIYNAFYPHFKDFPRQGQAYDVMQGFRYDNLLFGNFHLLMDFIDEKQSENVPWAKPGIFGSFPIDVDRSSYNRDQRICEDKLILRNYLTDLILFNDLIDKEGPNGRVFYGDFGLARDFRRLVKNPLSEIPLSLVFEMQVMVESLYAQRKNLDVHLTRMRKFNDFFQRQMKFILNDRFVFSNNMAGFKMEIDYMTKDFGKWLSSDFIHVFNTTLGAGTASGDEDALWRFNPWLTSNAICDQAMYYWQVGIDLFNGTAFISGTMHLWNFLKEMGYLKSLADRQESPSSRPPYPGPWPDSSNQPINKVMENSYGHPHHLMLIDILFHHFGRAVFCASAPPKEKFLNRWVILMGGKPENFARGRRQKRRTWNEEMETNQRRGRIDEHKMGRGPYPQISRAWTFAKSNYMRIEYVDENTERQRQQGGFYKTRWGANIHTSAPSHWKTFGTESTDIVDSLESIRELIEDEQGVARTTIARDSSRFVGATTARSLSYRIELQESGQGQQKQEDSKQQQQLQQYPLVTLDLVKIHYLCRDLHRRIYNDPFINRKMLMSFGEEYMENESQLPYFASWLMMLAEFPDRGGLKMHKELFEAVGKIVWEFLGNAKVTEVLIRDLL